jgi:uncharacterized protein YjeT (DUF2065 family)
MMRVKDWEFIGYMALAVGIIFIVGGIIAYEYSESYYGVVDYLYRGDSADLWIGGVSLLVVGVGCLLYAREENKRIPPSPSASPQQDIPEAYKP